MAGCHPPRNRRCSAHLPFVLLTAVLPVRFACAAVLCYQILFVCCIRLIDSRNESCSGILGNIKLGVGIGVAESALSRITWVLLDLTVDYRRVYAYPHTRIEQLRQHWSLTRCQPWRRQPNHPAHLFVFAESKLQKHHFVSLKSSFSGQNRCV